MGMISSERVFKLLDIDDEEQKQQLPTATHPAEMKGKVAFSHVWFAYNEEKWVLKDVSFSIKPGQNTWPLLDSTGSGKTTIIFPA
jgi:ATP-binding cassette subfamily B protein